MRINHLTLFIVTSVMVSSCDWGDFESVLVTPHYSIFYSQDFARRFSLPVEKAVDLNNAHLKAVAIGIQKINRNYECNIYFYYDDTIKLYSPNGQETFFKTSDKEGFFVRNYNAVDLKYNSNSVFKNSGRIIYRTKKIGPNVDGVYSSARYSVYKRGILPNLNMASVLVGCHFLETSYGDGEVWIQKAGVSNYKLIDEDPMNIKHKENNYHFVVPLALLQSVRPQIDRINAMPVDHSALDISVQHGPKE